MRGTVLGSLAVGLVLYFGVFHGSANPAVFLNSHAIILVIGGTFAVMMMVYPFKKIMEIFDFLAFGFFFHKKKNETATIENLIIGLHEFYQKPEDFRSFRADHPFINEAFTLMRDGSINEHDLELLLYSRRDSAKKKYQSEAKLLTNVSKFPPALGLLGAATGMIEMMGMLGKQGVEVIGQAMSVALTATFWGIGIANFILLPLADYATRLAQEDLYLRDTIIEGIVMAKKGYSEKVIVEHLLGKLPVAARLSLKKKLWDSLYFHNQLHEVSSHAA